MKTDGKSRKCDEVDVGKEWNEYKYVYFCPPKQKLMLKGVIGRYNVKSVDLIITPKFNNSKSRNETIEFINNL